MSRRANNGCERGSSGDERVRDARGPIESPDDEGGEKYDFLVHLQQPLVTRHRGGKARGRAGVAAGGAK